MVANAVEARIQKVCDLISGGLSFGKACEKVKIPKSSAWVIIRKTRENLECYARARESRVSLHAEEIIEISDNPQPGVIITTKADGSTETKECDMIEHRRLMVDSRKWLLSKIVRSTFGEKVDSSVSVSGSINHVLLTPELMSLASADAQKYLQPEKPANAREIDQTG